MYLQMIFITYMYIFCLIDNSYNDTHKKWKTFPVN